MKIKKCRVLHLFNDYMKLTHKIILFAVIISLMPIMFLSYFFYNKSEQIIYEEVSNSYNQILNQYVDNIQYKLSLYGTLINNITFNGVIQRTLDKDEREEFSEEMDVINKVSSEVESLLLDKYDNGTYNITIFPMDETYTYYQSHLGNVGTIKETEWYKNITSGKLPSYSGITQIIELNTSIMNLIRTIPSLKFDTYKKIIGIVKIDIYTDRLFKVNQEMIKNENQFAYIIDENNKVIFSTDKEFKVDSLFPEIEESKNEVSLNNKKGIMVTNNIEPYNWKVMMFFESSEIQKKIRDIRNSIAIVAMLIFVLVLFTILVFSKSFSKRVVLLMDKMKKVKAGNLEINEKIEGKDEIAMLDEDFNDMIFKLKELIKENYIENLEKREAQLNALQSQINPHFLYNTLEAINSMAAVYGCMEICTVSQKLGDIFRYNINSGKSEFVKLSEEINHIRNYEYIQRVRFDDKVVIKYDIPKEMYNYKVLKFILQPIVENSLYHGFSDEKPTGSISIYAYLVDDSIVLQIKDDGVGIPEGKLKELNKHINEKNVNINNKSRGGIGIRNVNNRIKLCFGESYGVKIESQVNKETVVTITLPAEL
jgi:two-component system, sensor histidine kinase YesM